MKCYIFQLDFSETFNIEQMYSESKPNMTKYGKFWIYSQKWVKKRRGILFKNLYLASNKKNPVFIILFCSWFINIDVWEIDLTQNKDR